MTGVRPLQYAPGEFIGGSFQLPDTPNGRTVLTFDLGEGHVSLHGAGPVATAQWLQHFASRILEANASQNTTHHITKAA